MCEFKVFLDGKQVAEDIVIAKISEESIILNNILGERFELKGCMIVEVNVPSEKLFLISNVTGRTD